MGLAQNLSGREKIRDLGRRGLGRASGVGRYRSRLPLGRGEDAAYLFFGGRAVPEPAHEAGRARVAHAAGLYHVPLLGAVRYAVERFLAHDLACLELDYRIAWAVPGAAYHFAYLEGFHDHQRAI